MAFLSDSERHTLQLLCDTFVPALNDISDADSRLYAVSASALSIPDLLETALERVTSGSDRWQLRVFLQSIENGWFNRLTSGCPRSFSDMTAQEREALLQSWAFSQHELARRSFQAFKRLTLFLFYSAQPNEQPNPVWPVFNYQPPTHDVENPQRPIHPLTMTEPGTLETDVLVIGSGAGGGVVAGELTESGDDVIVVEKGGYFADGDFHGRELASTETMFEKFGAMTTSDLGMVVLAGSTLGGGTTINWAASFRTPPEVLDEWAEEYGFSGAAGPEFQQSLDAVSRRINVNTDASGETSLNSALAQGCKALGYAVGVIPRNVKGCEECGFCNFGCAFGAKQGTLKTYLQDAYSRGARILVNAHVQRVLHQNGVASGAAVIVRDANGHAREFTIRAKVVVAAAGSIQTPALLLRSGLGNENIGANLHLHPATVIYGMFDRPIRGWEGPPMTRICQEFANLDGRGYGVRLETAPVHPGIAALSLSWESGEGHKQVMQRLDHLANILILTRDRHGGRVTVDGEGNPVLHYRLHPDDARHTMRGVREALRIHCAAGAYEISSPHIPRSIYRPADSSARDGGLDSFLETVESRGFQTNAFALFSAHQMSSCRIGGDTALGAVDPTGESYEVRNLFVADGSALPTASGVNPMVTIMATAHYISQRIKAKL